MNFWLIFGACIVFCSIWFSVRCADDMYCRRCKGWGIDEDGKTCECRIEGKR